MPLTGETKQQYELGNQRERIRNARDIAEPCAIKNQRRRSRCKNNFRKFLQTYTPQAFGRAFAPCHEDLIELCQTAILDTGKFVVALPRGSGKTTIMMRALLWASLYGHRRFPVLATADDGKFKSLLSGIKRLLEKNDRLAEDFPEVIHPIRMLEGVATRAVYQLWNGEPTHISWKTDMIRFADIPPARKRGNAGTIISGGGLTGALRGMTETTSDGEQLRPDCLLVDDPQTRKSAKSPTQVQEREDILQGDLLGLDDGVRPIAAMVSCTPIYEDDLAQRLLDPEHSMEWRGLRVPMLGSFPANLEAWEAYYEVFRQEALKELPAGSANDHYKKHREELDKGAAHYWPERVKEGRVSAIQTAMEEYFADPIAFAGEKQCQPESRIVSSLDELVAGDLLARQSGYKQGEIPADVSTVTCYVDVQGGLLYWMLCGWSDKFDGYVIDYGSHPRQHRRLFQLANVKKGLRSIYPGTDESGARRRGIKDLIAQINAYPLVRSDGAKLTLNLGLVDGRFATDDGETAILESDGGNWMLAFGTGIRAIDAPMSQWPKRPGRTLGDHWARSKPQGRQRLAIHIDTNHWKTETHGSISGPMENAGTIKFFKAPRSQHQMLVNHCLAEYGTKVEANKREVIEWRLRTSTLDNHLWDCLVNCKAAASVCGVKRRDDIQVEPPKKRKRVRSF